MNRRAILLGSLPLFIGGALMGAKAMRPKSDLELLADADMLLFPEDPIQGRGDRPSFADRGAWVMPFATFSVSAVVLSARSYDLGDDFQGEALPMDLALGWGPMSSPWVIKHVDISQRGRFYFWWVPHGAPVGARDVIRSSSNMHIFPANAAIEKKVSEVQHGDMVRLDGWLVDLEIGGRTIRSSRKRTDTGPGACEIVLVERILVGAAEISAG